MALVDYSSDSDSEITAPTLPSKPAASSSLSSSLSALLPKPKSKAGPSPIVASSGGSRKIVVGLAKAEEGAGDAGDDGPPNKRARIGGGSGLRGGLASMLPAPKKRVQNGIGGKSETGTGNRSENWKARNGDGDGDVAIPKPRLEKEEVSGPRLKEEGKEKEVKRQPPPKPVVQFMPQNVARRTIKPMSSFRKKKAPGSEGVAGGIGARTASVPEKSKSKVSLFGAVTEPTHISSTKPVAEYKPLLVTSATVPSETTPQPSSEAYYDLSAHHDPNAHYDPNLAYQTSMQLTSNPNSLESIAQTIGLDDTAMRQLLGRKGRGQNNMPDISQIATFDVNTEYASNTLLARSEEAQRVASVNPVRSIAPGKHQLTQLLNAAQHQKGALEEAFAEGKRNRREAGGKYGW
ncbi:mitotic checkpoint regulator, MAD2B-interacting-domain-containing protein [Tirmania nivea]|nr:mitotic checkpoint regulator, MAD2B-interacting-domain-containing protein [Tirmania nivea]